MTSNSAQLVHTRIPLSPDGQCVLVIWLLRGASERMVMLLESPHPFIDDVPRELSVAIPDVHKYAIELCGLKLDGASPFVSGQVNFVRALCQDIFSLDSKPGLLTWKALQRGTELASLAIKRRALLVAETGEA